MKLYLYAIIDSNDRIESAIHGLRGEGVFNIPYRDIAAVVSEIDQASGAATEGDVMEHETAVERLMTDFTVLPVRFRTVFNRRDDLLSMMQAHYADFRDNLERLHNKLEFGVKVIWPANKIRRNIVGALECDKQQESGSCISPGKRFMDEKFETYRIDKEFEAKADKFIRIVDTFLGKFAAEKKLRKLRTENLLLDAVYLVEKSQESDLREAFWHIQNAHPGFKFLFSGPWPAYNFVALSGRSGLFSGDPDQGGLFAGAVQPQILEGVGSA